MASDSAGLSIKSDWFNVEFKPIAEATSLMQGTETLKAIQIGGSSRKNTTIDLQSVLNLNAIAPTDKDGDEVIFKLLVKQPEAELKGPTSAIIEEIISEGKIFSIQMDKLDADANGSLSGIRLELSPNQLQLLPRALKAKRQAGIELEVWTETRVKGDQTGTFNVAPTERKTVWVPIENAAPVFTSPSLKLINENFFSRIDESSPAVPGELSPGLPVGASTFLPGEADLQSNLPLIKIADLFQDTDAGDKLEWELDIPKNLIGLIELDKETGHVKLSESVKDLKDLPAGSHRLTVRAKDSSGLLGDSSGIRSGSIRLLVTPPEDALS